MKNTKIQNFYNVIFNKKWKKIILIFIGLILLNSLISITTGFNTLSNIAKVFFNLNVGPEDEVKSVEILSDKDQGPGSFKVTKSAKWLKGNEAEITFNVNSRLKVAGNPIDIILVLDTSESMAATKNNKSKLKQVQSDAIALTNTILTNQESRIALVEFNSYASVKSDFTNDASKINSLINSFKAYEATNYKDALVKAQDILKGTCNVCSGNPYVPNENRELVILFLSDGYPVRETPYEVGEYEKIKTDYPNITINAIQYEMGERIAKELVDISDNQYVSYIGNLRNVLYAASTAIKFYEKLDITDLIDTDSFEVKSASDIKVSDGKVEFDEENQSIIWHVSEYDEALEQYTFMTSHSAEMKIKIYLRDDLKNMTGLYPTNKKEIIDYKLEEVEQNITEPRVPKLYNGYTLTYDYNLPSECHDSYKKTTESEIHSILDVIDITKKEAPVCASYQFQGWSLTNEDERYINGENDEEINYKINDTSFKMPWKDIRLMGVWTKFGITKMMDGGIYKEKTVPLINRIKENGVDPTLGRIPRDDESSTYVTGAKINFGVVPSDTNGKGLYIRAGAEKDVDEGFDGETIYYYRGNVTNNNVIFAGFCWKIVRTTETGGIKLIYNGTPVDSQCSNTNATIGASAFNSSTNNNYYNSLSYSGYMYGKVYKYENKQVAGSRGFFWLNTINTDKAGYYFSKTPPIYDNEKQKYVFNDYVKKDDETWTTVTSTLGKDWNGYYSCLDDGINECETVYYILEKSPDWNNGLYRLEMEKGETIENAASNKKMKLSQEIADNGDGTYSLVNPIEVSYVDWYNNFNTYKKYYICSLETQDTCTNVYLTSETSSKGYSWSINEELTFGNDVEYNALTKMYTLKGAIAHKSKDTAWNGNNYSTKHYMCIGNTETCDTVYYIFYSFNNGLDYISYITLKGEANIESALEEMFSNKVNSTIKYRVDGWYNTNIKNNYENYLEDAVWCNDRSVAKQSDYGGWHKDNNNFYNRLDSYFYYGSYGGRNLTRSGLTVNPGLRDELACPLKRDRFTKESERGNKALVNPIGLITADEVIAAGKGSSSYLYYKSGFWTLSPSYAYSNYYIFSYGNFFIMGFYSESSEIGLAGSNGVRPAISLNGSVEVLENGDGSVTRPYVVS